MYVRLQKARRLVEDREYWIRKELSKIQDSLTLFDTNTQFKTNNNILHIKCNNIDCFKTTIKDGEVKVFVPKNNNIYSDVIQIRIREIIENIWRKEAKQYLPRRAKELAIQHNFQYNNISIRNAKTRWGSCSFNNNINLNLHLMRLPNNLIDYVILHELTHTRIKNHSSKFWKLLDSVLNGAKELDKELKKFRVEIY